MSIDSLTIGEAKQIAAWFGQQRPETQEVAPELIGKYVICRSRNEGVNAGYLVSAARGTCTLREARRLWKHAPNDKSQGWYEGVANSGLRSDSQISAKVPIKVIVEENYSLTACSPTGQSSIEGFRTHGQ